MELKRHYNYKFIMKSDEVNIEDSTGYFLFTIFKKFGEKVGCIKNDIPLIGKASKVVKSVNMPIDLISFKHYQQIPFVTSIDNPSAAPMKVVWVGYSDVVDLQYALLASGVRKYLKNKAGTIEAVFDLMLVKLNPYIANQFIFEVPLYRSCDCSTLYEDDTSKINNIGTYIATSLDDSEDGISQSITSFLKEKPYCESARYVCSLDLLNYVYSFIYKVNSVPDETLKCHEVPTGYLNGCFAIEEYGLSDALEKIWGNDLCCISASDENNFLKDAYSCSVESNKNSAGIIWSSYKDIFDRDIEELIINDEMNENY